MQIIIYDFCLRHASKFGSTFCILVHHDAQESDVNRCKQREGFLLGDRTMPGLISLSMIFNQHSHTLYLRMRPIYDILPLRLSAVCWHGKWLRNQKTWFDFTLTGQRRKYERISFTFDFWHFTFTETHRWYNYSLSLHFIEKILCWPIYSQSKPPLKFLDCCRQILNGAHIDSYYCKPELTSWRYIKMTAFHTRCMSPNDQK